MRRRSITLLEKVSPADWQSRLFLLWSPALPALHRGSLLQGFVPDQLAAKLLSGPQLPTYALPLEIALETTNASTAIAESPMAIILR